MSKQKEPQQYITPGGKIVSGPPHLNKPKSPYEPFHFINGIIFVIVF